MRMLKFAGAALIAGFVSWPAAAQEIRIGYINTLSGPGALLGKAQLNGFMLGLEREGWKENGHTLGGIPMKLSVADDHMRPDGGLRAARKMLLNDKVHVVVGIMFSNVLMPVQRAVIRGGGIMMTTNAGAAPMSGAQCSRYFLATSFNNDQVSESLGQLVNDEKVDSVVALAPNYQAGKDMIAGFKRFYKGKVASEILFKLGQSDYQTEISKVRSLNPKAVMIFAPGGMGISFMKQWAAAGMNKEVDLYTVAVVDWLTLKPIGAAAVGSYHAIHWNADSDNPENQRFIKNYSAKYKRYPAFYSAQAYDAARLLAATLRRIGPKFVDRDIFARALRHTPFPSVRGQFSFNVNGIPIQDWYRRDVVMGADGKPKIVTRGVIFEAKKDSYWQECPKAERL